MEKFMIGNAVVYGNLVCKPSQLTEIKEKPFFKMLENSLKKNDSARSYDGERTEK